MKAIFRSAMLGSVLAVTPLVGHSQNVGKGDIQDVVDVNVMRTYACSADDHRIAAQFLFAVRYKADNEKVAAPKVEEAAESLTFVLEKAFEGIVNDVQAMDFMTKGPGQPAIKNLLDAGQKSLVGFVNSDDELELAGDLQIASAHVLGGSCSKLSGPI